MTNIFDRRWDKLIGNNVYNAVTTLTGRNYGALHDDPDMHRMMRRMFEEGLKVARAEGAKIAEGRIEQVMDYTAKNLRDSNSSTLQDLRRGRRLEYDAITGAVIRAARRHRDSRADHRGAACADQAARPGGFNLSIDGEQKQTTPAPLASPLRTPIRKAWMNGSMSPSSTAPVLPISTPVRWSFTIW